MTAPWQKSPNYETKSRSCPPQNLLIFAAHPYTPTIKPTLLPVLRDVRLQRLTLPLRLLNPIGCLLSRKPWTSVQKRYRNAPRPSNGCQMSAHSTLARLPCPVSRSRSYTVLIGGSDELRETWSSTSQTSSLSYEPSSISRNFPASGRSSPSFLPC